MHSKLLSVHMGQEIFLCNLVKGVLNHLLKQKTYASVHLYNVNTVTFLSCTVSVIFFEKKVHQTRTTCRFKARNQFIWLITMAKAFKLSRNFVFKQNIENNGKQNLLKIKNLIVTFDLCHKQSFFFCCCFSNFTFDKIKHKIY